VTRSPSRTHSQRLASRDGYFAPDSVLRRIGGSPLIPLLGAGPAVLFQVAHPLVAASVVQSSDYRSDLWRRWLRTVRALYLIVFGSKAEAEAVGEAVYALHDRIRGRTMTRLGPFPAGTPYAGTDPELMLWVIATLTEVAFAVYTRLVHRLSLAEERRFYREMTVVAGLVGVPAPVVPATLKEFRAYMRAQLSGPEIVVTPPAREVAAFVLEAPLPAPLRLLAPAHRLATAGLLPPRLREEYGLAWSRPRAVALGLAASSVRAGAAPLLLTAARVPQPAFA
jgi:uncharacterized protein (DUF2236 family)